ncbi:hypothetical protein CYD53_11148 [Bosea psychrotolerans]|uniref:Uncharacterized protein n=1 Tax=Bosea psychrotolerans TaxID=1871628 RepID=A0A2S4M4I4_9HYPH|nr:hypothetical protein CYD53_11148 [Bosea psychrotolerans]
MVVAAGLAAGDLAHAQAQRPAGEDTRVSVVLGEKPEIDLLLARPLDQASPQAVETKTVIAPVRKIRVIVPSPYAP